MLNRASFRCVICVIFVLPLTTVGHLATVSHRGTISYGPDPSGEVRTASGFRMSEGSSPSRTSSLVKTNHAGNERNKEEGGEVPTYHARRVPSQPSAQRQCSESPFPFVMINLKRRSDRRAMMESRLPSWICMKTCRMEAIDSKSLARPPYISEGDWSEAHNGTKYNEKRKENDWGPLTPGAIALLASSRQVWERIISTNVTTVIMEDDVWVKDKNMLLGMLCDLQKRSDWELVQFQYNPPVEEKFTSPTLKEGLSANTGMYVVTPPAAQRLRDTLDRGTSVQLDYNSGVLRTALPPGMTFRAVPTVVFQGLDNKTDVQEDKGVTIKAGSLSIHDCSVH